MTEKQIEQKAEEYIKNTVCNDCADIGYCNGECLYPELRKQSFIDGYHECQKEHEWHYVKDSLPEEDVYVLLWCKNDTFPVVACRHTFTSWGRTDWEWDCKWGSGFEIKQNDPRVIAWQEITPPKEIE